MRLHAVVSTYGPDSFGLHSPQVPELFAGGASAGEYQGEALVEVLSKAGAPSEYTLVEHRQVYESREGREWFVRFCLDRVPSHDVERKHTLSLLRDLLDVTPEPIDNATKAPTGEALFLVVRLDDTVGWVSEQLDAAGVATMVARPRDDNALWLVDVTRQPRPDSIHVDPSTTVRELIESSGDVMQEGSTDFLTDSPGPDVSRVPELVAV